MPSGGTIFDLWSQWKKWGTLPRKGGLLDQPIDIMVKIQAIDLVHQTVMYQNSGPDNYDMKTLSPTQKEIIKWLEKRDDK